MRLRFLLALPAALLLSGCGYIGDPLPPLANIPVRVTDLAATQRGSRIIAHFTIPDKTTEGFPVPTPLTFDLRAGTVEPFDENEWATKAKHIPSPDINGPIASYEFPSAEWTGKDVVLGVRITGGTGKQTAWSNFVVVHAIAPLPTPQVELPVSAPAGVRLNWRAAGSNFRVLRKPPEGEYAVAAETTVPEWTDTSVEFGKPYSYMVQTIHKFGDGQAESDFSKEVSLTPTDMFAPAVPSGLRADPSPASIELVWDRNTEPDFAGYRVYRAEGNSEWKKIADVDAGPAYSDRTAERGKPYRYAVTSVDRAGNESNRSETVTATW